MDTAGGFGTLDWIVLLGYFLGVTGFGLWIARRIRSSGSYFLGDRQLPWWVMVGQSFGTGTNAENPVAQTGASFNAGFATIWYQWKNILITPFYWLMAPWYRRSERTTIGEIVEDRYGSALAMVYTFFAIAFLVFNQGAMLKGAGKIISVATGGQIISPDGVVLLMTVAFILYSFFGGLIAAAYTDFIQGLLIIVLSFLLIPLGLRVIGGFSGLHESLPPHFFDLYSEASGLDLFTIVMLTLNGLVGITAMPHTLSMNATGSSERAGRVGQTYGSLVKRFCTIGWALTGLIVAAMVLKFGTELDDPEAAFGFASLHLLGPGLTGLMVACVMAANMSTCSNFMVNTGALFTRNVYAPRFPNSGDRRLLWVGRFSGLSLTGLGVLFAFYVDQVLQAFLFTETIAALMGIMFLGGILWKRANRQGAWAATILAFVTYYFMNYLMTCQVDGQTADTLRQSFGWLRQSSVDGALGAYVASGELMLVYKWMPGPFGCAMLSGLAGLILVSLCTAPEDAGRLERFFDNMRRSTDHETLPEGESKPLAADEGKDLVLLDLPSWLTAERWHGFFHRYREDLVGFTLAWGMVFGLVGIAWLLMRIGG
ncbi:MAG: sodium:solute symporter family protein [Pirellulales bacterium]|nr:sodium:solute symporter family protein [Pirellulales bacterium]